MHAKKHQTEPRVSLAAQVGWSARAGRFAASAHTSCCEVSWVTVEIGAICLPLCKKNTLHIYIYIYIIYAGTPKSFKIRPC